MKTIRIILFLIGIAATICCLLLGKYALAAFNGAVAMINLYLSFEE